MNKKLQKILSLVIGAFMLFAFCGCSGEEVSKPVVSIASGVNPAKGYNVSTDENGNTTVTNPEGDIIADSGKGDNIILSEDGNVIITDKEGHSTVINNNGTVVTPQESNQSSTRPSSAQQLTGDNTITLKGDSVDLSGKGTSIVGKDVVITGEGTYIVSGTLNDGRIVVDAAGKDVKIILNGASISNSNNSAFYAYAAKSVELSAHDGSVNVFNDGISYVYTDRYSSASSKQPDGTLSSKTDLKLSGKGKLSVNSKSKNGVVSKTTLKVENINLAVSSSGHGIEGADGLDFSGATVSVTSGRDAVRTNNITDTSKGKINLTSTNMALVSGEDGIQADTVLTLNSGSYNIKAGGGSASAPLATSSKKGIKGVSKLVINGGTVVADCSDDALHSNGNVDIKGGSMSLKSADDGIHADKDITISGGCATIDKSYEGLEATNITLSGGKVKITSDDDGINISGGDGSANTGRPGMDMFGSAGGTLKMSGGTLRIKASGDGIDANGNIEISGGTIAVDGASHGGNGVLDFDKSFNISGGTLLGVGTSSMAQAPSTSSTQNSVVFYLNNNYQSGNIIRIVGSDGSVVCTYLASCSFDWVCISSPKIKIGVTYTVYVGGSCDGKLSDGFYTSGTYKGGTADLSVTANSVVSANKTSSGGPGGMPGGFGGGGRPPM